MKFSGFYLFLLLGFTNLTFAKRSISDVKDEPNKEASSKDNKSSNEKASSESDVQPGLESESKDSKDSKEPESQDNKKSETDSEKPESNAKAPSQESEPKDSKDSTTNESKDKSNDSENKNESGASVENKEHSDSEKSNSADKPHDSDANKMKHIEVANRSVVKDKNYKEEQAMLSQEIEDIDSEDEGNWLLKRVWWEQGQDLFEKIMMINNQITKNQVNIMNLREKELKSADVSFKSFGLEKDKLETQVFYVFQLLDNSKNEDLVEDFSALEQDLYDKVQKYEDEYKSLKTSLDELSKNDDLLIESIGQINQLVEECSNDEKQSWNYLKEIGQTLNDEKAKDLFYKIQSNYENIEASLNYINTELDPFIKESLSSIKKNSESIVSILKDLESKEASLEQVIEEHQDAWKAKEKAKKLQEKKKKEMLAKKKRLANRTWYQKVWDWIKSWF